MLILSICHDKTIRVGLHLLCHDIKQCLSLLFNDITQLDMVYTGYVHDIKQENLVYTGCHDIKQENLVYTGYVMT